MRHIKVGYSISSDAHRKLMELCKHENRKPGSLIERLVEREWTEKKQIPQTSSPPEQQ